MCQGHGHGHGPRRHAISCPCAQHADPLPLRSLDCVSAFEIPNLQGPRHPMLTSQRPLRSGARSLQPITSRPTTALSLQGNTTAAPFTLPQCARPAPPSPVPTAQERGAPLTAVEPSADTTVRAAHSERRVPSPHRPPQAATPGSGRTAAWGGDGRRGRLLSPWPCPFPPRTLPGVPCDAMSDAMSAGGNPERSATAQNGAQYLPTGGSGDSSVQRMRTVPRTGEP